ncbi:MAG: hypothetical protein KIS96_01190 [Bauldia sp.]|nr:hypothetical protein [Bauldia sp.]
MAALALPTADQAYAARFAAARPVDAPDPGLGGAIGAAFRAVEARISGFRAEELRRDVVQEYLDRLYAATGERLENPAVGAPMSIRTDWRSIFTPARDLIAELWATTRERYDAWAVPAGYDPFPTDEAIEEEVRARRQAQLEEAQATLGAARTTDAAIGRILGGLAAPVMLDPIVGGSLGLGAPFAAGILRTALIEAGIGFGAEIVSGVAHLGGVRAIDPGYGLDDIMGQAAFAAGGGAVFGGGIRALAALWSAVRGRAWPSSVRDAGIVVEHQAVHAPPGATVAEQSAYAARAAIIEADMLAGIRPRQLDLPFPQSAGRAAEPPAPSPAAAMPADRRPAVTGEGAAPGRPSETPSIEGVSHPQRLQSANLRTDQMLTRAYGEPLALVRALREPGSPARAIAAGMADAAEPWARMREAAAAGDIPAGMDITGSLIEALQLVTRAGGRPERLAAAIDQGTMFGGPSPAARQILRGLIGDGSPAQLSPRRVSAFLTDYADEALRNTAAPRLIGDPLRADEVMATALAKAGRADLYADAVELTRPAAIEKAIDNPEVARATLHEVDQLLTADPDMTIAITVRDAAGDTMVVTRPLREVLDELEADALAAREIEACVVGDEA